MPTDPKKNRLAVRVEDQALSHLDHADDGGAVRVRTRDRGTHTAHEFGENRIVVTLHGERVAGKHAMFRTYGKNWLVYRMSPAPETAPQGGRE